MPIADEASPLYGQQTLLAEGSEIYEEIFEKQLIIFLKPEEHYATASCEEWNRLLKKELALYNIICLKARQRRMSYCHVYVSGPMHTQAGRSSRI